MKDKLTVAVLFSLLIVSVFPHLLPPSAAQTENSTDVFVGIDVAYNNVTAIKSLVNETSEYTNFFIIGTTGITQNTSQLNDICQYLYEKGLSFVVYQEWPLEFKQGNPKISNWTNFAKEQWGDYFLGFNYLDEPGGRQLDNRFLWEVIGEADNASHAYTQFMDHIGYSVNWFKDGYANMNNIPLFVTDYALYWFDYKAGYDVLLTQFGWNYSRQLNVALCRGAATIQNKEWGSIIAWEYTEPPYIQSGEKLYEDLVLAYENGAKYITIFDSDENYTQSILKQEHLEALERFWNYTQEQPRAIVSGDRVALVLPDGYAYGFRGPDDKIWGYWEANLFSYELSVEINKLFDEYGTRLDIIYDEELEEGNNYGYSKMIHWTELGLTPYYSFTPSPSKTPSATTLPTVTPDNSPSASPQNNDENFYFNYILIGGIATIIIALALIVLNKKLNFHFN